MEPWEEGDSDQRKASTGLHEAGLLAVGSQLTSRLHCREAWWVVGGGLQPVLPTAGAPYACFP